MTAVQIALIQVSFKRKCLVWISSCPTEADANNLKSQEEPDHCSSSIIFLYLESLIERCIFYSRSMALLEDNL